MLINIRNINQLGWATNYPGPYEAVMEAPKANPIISLACFSKLSIDHLWTREESLLPMYKRSYLLPSQRPETCKKVWWGGVQLYICSLLWKNTENQYTIDALACLHNVVIIQHSWDITFFHHYQGSIDFNTVNIHRTVGMYFLVSTGNRGDIEWHDLERS